jgi:hypothetical protein
LKRIDTPETEKKSCEKIGMILGKLSAILCGTVTGWLLFWGYRGMGKITLLDGEEFDLVWVN